MSEITKEYIIEYLNAIQKNDDSLIENIRNKAIEENVPIIRKEVKQLLEVLLSIIKPKSILEIGTAVGYSTIIMSRYLQPNGSITTIERSEIMIKKAKENIIKAGKEEIINLIEGSAQDILPSIEDKFDVIFMDAAKGQYLTFLPHCIRLLKEGGILISDNALQDGIVAKSRWSIARRNRTIHQRMRTFLWELNHNDKLKTSILPIGDGVTISYKIKN